MYILGVSVHDYVEAIGRYKVLSSNVLPIPLGWSFTQSGAGSQPARPSDPLSVLQVCVATSSFSVVFTWALGSESNLRVCTEPSL